MKRTLATAVVVLSSAAVLVLEVTVVRLVAPFAGDTLETYTAAIGVALGAIALGTKLGGDAADRWPPAWPLSPLLVLGGGFTMLSRPLIIALGPALAGGGPLTALLLVAFGITVPVALLSAVTPVVVKTQLADLGQTGRIVGRFSAWSTVGALAGTFLTGYVLIATLPVSSVLLATGVVLVLLGVVSLAGGGRGTTAPRGMARLLGRAAPQRRSGGSRIGAAMTAVVVLGAGLLVGVSSPCDVETAYYCARVERDPDRESGRVLFLDDLRHGYVDVADPRHLEFGYTQWFAAAIDTHTPAGEPLSALHVGGGAFTMPGWLAATRPGSRSTVLELDPAVVELAYERLSLSSVPDLTVRTGDARTAIAAEPHSGFDVIIGDAFGGLSVPWHLTTREFNGEVAERLRPGGVYVANVIDHRPRRFLAAQVATLDAVFRHVAVIGASGDFASGAWGGNHVIVASDAPIDRAELGEAVGEAPEEGRLAGPRRLADWRKRGRVLTDDFAPVDQLLTPYPR